MPGEAVRRCEFDGKELILRLDVTMARHLDAVNSLVEHLMGVIREMGRAAGPTGSTS